MSKIDSRAALLLLFTCGITSGAAETLEGALRGAKIPVQQFSVSDLDEKITSYAISKGIRRLLPALFTAISGKLTELD